MLRLVSLLSVVLSAVNHIDAAPVSTDTQAMVMYLNLNSAGIHFQKATNFIASLAYRISLFIMTTDLLLHNNCKTKVTFIIIVIRCTSRGSGI